MRSWDRLQRQLVAALDRGLAGAPLRIPEAGRQVWGWFVDLCATRTYHASGPNPIAYGEIEAYARLSGWPIAARHVDAIRALDAAWLKGQRPTSQVAVAQRPKVAIGPAAFDAVFG